eukprot:gene28822-34790_t
MDHPVDSSSAVSQKLLEQNEDMLGAIVENLQLGRLEEAMQLYLVLQSNLNVLAAELDSYPMENANVYAEMFKFPDKVMRKSCLEDLLPFEEKLLLSMPIMPPCEECFKRNFSAYQCRVTLHHSQEFNPRLGHHEQQETLRAAQILLARQRQQMKNDKRGYKKWNAHEKYTLCIGIQLYGRVSYDKLGSIIPGRSEKQIKNFVTKQLKDVNAIPSLEELVARPPPGYTPPHNIAHLFGAQRSHANDAVSPTALDLLEQSAIADVRNDFVGMVGIAMGIEMHFPASAAAAPSSVTATVACSASAGGGDDKHADRGDAMSKSIKHEDTAKRAAMLLESYHKKDMSMVASTGSDPNSANSASNSLALLAGAAGMSAHQTQVPKRSLPAFALPGLKRLQQSQSSKVTISSADENVAGSTTTSTIPTKATASTTPGTANFSASTEERLACDSSLHTSDQAGVDSSTAATDAKKKTPLVRRKKACIPVEVAEPLGLVGAGRESVLTGEGKASPKQTKKKMSGNSGTTIPLGDATESGATKKKAVTKKVKDAAAATAGGAKSLLSQVQENLHNAVTSSGISRAELPPVDYYNDGTEGILIDDIGEGFSFF